jgi:hypothetical protein
MKRKTKDQIGNWAGLGLAIGTALTGIGATLPGMPKEVTIIGVILATFSGAIIGWLTGKPTTP